MNIKSRLLFWTLFILGGTMPESLQAQGVEICDNGVDDDQDGLIDLNDSDCFCQLAEATSLIPNPSFEDQLCCPPDRSRMDCAETWIQASTATTDYIHTCGWEGWVDLPMPMPIPDGEGAMGFRNGRFARNNGDGPNEDNLNWKEYAGACLTSPLRAGVTYKFQFYVGFTIQPFSPPITLTFFGTTNCANLPFGGDDREFGCPTNGPGWMQLSAVNTSGTSEWKQLELNVTPTEDIYAIAIGPPCGPTLGTESPYYFFDNLVLAEQSAFEFDIQINNEPCAPNLSFEIPEYDSLSYQWYKDGVAIIGATNAQLETPPGKGRYEVRLISNNSCRITKPINFFQPIKTNFLTQTICGGETYALGNRQLSTPGIYTDTLKTAGNCDSIVQIELIIDDNKTSAIEAKIFPNESYMIGNSQFSQPGEYTETISSNAGCDSTIQLILSHYAVYMPNIFSPNGDGINDFFIINGGQELTSVDNLTIFDRWGNQVYHQTSLSNGTNKGWDGQSGGKEVSSGVYIYTANVFMDDGKERAISGMVTLIR